MAQVHNQPFVSPPRSHLAIFMIDKDVPCAIVLQVSDLQSVWVPDFCRLESRI